MEWSLRKYSRRGIFRSGGIHDARPVARSAPVLLDQYFTWYGVTMASRGHGRHECRRYAPS